MTWILAQQPEAGRASEQQEAAGFVPGQKRVQIDPAQVARGKTLFGINCQACHGQDLRGGDLGGPNLLRSQVTLSDKDGELIVPVIQGSRQAMGMPAIGLNMEDSKIVAAYIRSVIGTIGRQGAPPGKQKPPTIVVGNAGDGRAYFISNCGKCHSAEGDLQGVASRITDPKVLQTAWLQGGSLAEAHEGALVKATITLPTGEKVDGTLVRADDFLVTVKLRDSTIRTFRRDGNVQVTLLDPLKAHKDLLPLYTDKDVHDITAYLVTLK
ncbi:c-type cytochrome [Granulicella sp. dw_53]|uniref:c-type cytochrome n=1 Tax=Granulicella sp. dw_53 TaxID=2719792 RepID=UPI001BD21041|nr:c-type cytochrome [Granulicella sp. dw_53]